MPNMITRAAENQVLELLQPGKVLILYGPRRVGKSTLLRTISKRLSEEPLIVNGEEKLVGDVFSSHDSARFQGFIGNHKILFIDEAQHIPEIGENLKLLVDTLPEVSILATGSSSFDLVQKFGEPLTGRKNVVTLYPVSQLELTKNFGEASTLSSLEERLTFGSYPEVVTSVSFEKKEEYLRFLTDSYLYRDVLQIEEVRNPTKIYDLLRLLAFQIGQGVSLNELAGNLGISRNTVVRYLYLLEKSFVLINIRGYSRNLRKEITKNSRYYFWDNGVRNAVISNFNLLNVRDDVGRLWENFLVSERIKTQSYSKTFSNNYFWRTYEGQEIDWVEERGGNIFGFEFKWSKEKSKIPSSWQKAYPNAQYSVVSNLNYLNFLTKI